MGLDGAGADRDRRRRGGGPWTTVRPERSIPRARPVGVGRRVVAVVAAVGAVAVVGRWRAPRRRAVAVGRGAGPASDRSTAGPGVPDTFWSVPAGGVVVTRGSLSPGCPRDVSGAARPPGRGRGGGPGTPDLHHHRAHVPRVADGHDDGSVGRRHRPAAAVPPSRRPGPPRPPPRPPGPRRRPRRRHGPGRPAPRRSTPWPPGGRGATAAPRSPRRRRSVAGVTRIISTVGRSHAPSAPSSGASTPSTAPSPSSSVRRPRSDSTRATATTLVSSSRFITRTPVGVTALHRDACRPTCGSMHAGVVDQEQVVVVRHQEPGHDPCPGRRAAGGPARPGRRDPGG